MKNVHIAFVDSNPGALEAITCAKAEGHQVSFIEELQGARPAGHQPGRGADRAA
jgi:hypothetical protein